MDAVLDTNVIISALISPLGAPAQIFAAWQSGRFTHVTSPALLGELSRALAYPRIAKRRAWTGNERAEFLEMLRMAAKLVIPTIKIDAIAEDLDDNRVLEAAIAADAEFIVSGDRHLLDLATYERVMIVTPARFLARLSLESS